MLQRKTSQLHPDFFVDSLLIIELAELVEVTKRMKDQKKLFLDVTRPSTNFLLREFGRLGCEQTP